MSELLNTFGPVEYIRNDLRLSHPVEKNELVAYLHKNAPNKIGHLQVNNVQTNDGIKYLMEDDNWLLIRPSGTEPVLRIYAEGRSKENVEALMEYGRKVAENT